MKPRFISGKQLLEKMYVTESEFRYITFNTPIPVYNKTGNYGFRVFIDRNDNNICVVIADNMIFDENT